MHLGLLLLDVRMSLGRVCRLTLLVIDGWNGVDGEHHDEVGVEVSVLTASGDRRQLFVVARAWIPCFHQAVAG